MRPYKTAFSHEKALEIMRGDSGKIFDPDVFDVFLALEQEFARLCQELKAAATNSQAW